MKVFSESKQIREPIAACKNKQEKIALVPTMGHLHDGHIALIQLAKSLAPRVIVSIFVNPLQFNQENDFTAYPRTLTSDLEKLTALDIDAVFTPQPIELYPDGIELAPKIIIPKLTAEFDGEFRPGHFDGVCTVVTKLFNILTPDIAVFGNKDYQQLLIIRRMTRDLNFNIDIVAGNTERESDGLALSSRNSHLSAAERARAANIFAILSQTKTQFSIQDIPSQEHFGTTALEKIGMNVEYFSIRDALDLQPINNTTKDIVVLTAAWLGDIRLIDNVLFPIG